MTDQTSFQKELDERTHSCDKIVCSFLPDQLTDVKPYFFCDEDALTLTVEEAVNYSVRAGGKRLRPLIMELSFELCGGTNREILAPFMAAIEFIHTYSLVHDDLPAMDNDEYRRGKKTTHAVYGEAMAILAGDGLLNYAFETALKASESCTNNEDLIHVVLALRILAAKAGIHGMVGGQCVDIESEHLTDAQDQSDGILFFIHENKTAALLEAAFMCGAILAGAAVDVVDTLEKTGSLIGHAFQIRDDILDETSSLSVLGKSIGKDKEEGKLTYTAVHGLDQSEKQVALYSDEAMNNLKELGALPDSFLVQLVEFLTNRTY